MSVLLLLCVEEIVPSSSSCSITVVSAHLLILWVILLLKSKCCIPANYCENLFIDSVIINEEQNSVVEGSNVTFTCPPRRVLTGPNTSTCMANGQWYPDPRNLKCTGETKCSCVLGC